MGMDAELIAIGRFSKHIVAYLDYPLDYYNDTLEGVTVITGVCNCVSSQGSRELAQALGIKSWQFEQHCDIPMNGVDFNRVADAIEDPEHVVRIVALAAAGFKFYFRPNG